MTDTDYTDDATHNAWIVGTHDLPLEFLNIDAEIGNVIVVDVERNTFDVLTKDEFNDQFEWLNEEEN